MATTTHKLCAVAFGSVQRTICHWGANRAGNYPSTTAYCFRKPLSLNEDRQQTPAEKGLFRFRSDICCGSTASQPFRNSIWRYIPPFSPFPAHNIGQPIWLMWVCEFLFLFFIRATINAKWRVTAWVMPNDRKPGTTAAAAECRCIIGLLRKKGSARGKEWKLPLIEVVLLLLLLLMKLMLLKEMSWAVTLAHYNVPLCCDLFRVHRGELRSTERLLVPHRKGDQLMFNASSIHCSVSLHYCVLRS